jgi:hypothetical protein
MATLKIVYEGPTLKPGLWWARRTKNDPWELVELRCGSYRPKDWFKEGTPKFEVFSMGWDCDEPASNFVEFRKAELITPDGVNYEAGK